MKSQPIRQSPQDAFEDEGDLRAMEEKGEEEFNEIEDRYYQQVRTRLGTGHRDPHLDDFHKTIDLVTQSNVSAYPRSMESYDDIPGTPPDHPLRAIAAVLHQAEAGSTIRVFAYSLTDVATIDLLVHAGKSNTVQILLQSSGSARKSLNKWTDEVGKADILEHLEIHLCECSNFGSDQTTVFNSCQDCDDFKFDDHRELRFVKVSTITKF